MRVTFDPVLDGMPGINAAASQLAEAQEQVSSGLRVRLPSDDPLAARQIVLEQSTLGSIDTYTQSAGAASPKLSAADSALGDIVDKLTQAISAATGARGTTSDQDTLNSIAQTIQGLRGQILADLNTTVDGSSLFAGSQTTTTAYAQVGGVWTYQGDNNAVQVNVQQNRNVSVAVSGQEIAQGSASTDIFTTLDALATAIQNNDQTGIGDGIAAVQAAFTRATQAQTRVGLDEDSVTEAESQLTTQQSAATTRLSSLQDANLAQAATQMTQAQTAYQAALGAVGATEKVSLLDYLR